MTCTQSSSCRSSNPKSLCLCSCRTMMLCPVSRETADCTNMPHLLLQVQPWHHAADKPVQELRILLGLRSLCVLLCQPPPLHSAQHQGCLCPFQRGHAVPVCQPDVSALKCHDTTPPCSPCHDIAFLFSIGDVSPAILPNQSACCADQAWARHVSRYCACHCTYRTA